jgi:hypothetical protein
MISSIEISINDFEKISKSNEFWLWHLIEAKENPILELQPLSRPFTLDRLHTLEEIVKKTEIPFFETNVYDCVDFLMYLDNTILHKLKNKDKKNVLGPVVLGFNHSRLVYSTIHHCYCPEGVLEVIGKLNPEYLIKMLND